MHIADLQEWVKTPSQCDSLLQVLQEEGSEAHREGSPPLKRFKHLDKVIEQRWREDLEKSAKLPPGRAKVERYFELTITLAEKVDPVTFWNESQYPLFSPVATT